MSITLKATKRKGNNLSDKSVKYYRSAITAQVVTRETTAQIQAKVPIPYVVINQVLKALGEVLSARLAEGEQVDVYGVGTFRNNISSAEVMQARGQAEGAEDKDNGSDVKLRYSVHYTPTPAIMIRIKKTNKEYK